MQRRTFLKGILGIAVATPLTTIAAVPTILAPEEKPPLKKMPCIGNQQPEPTSNAMRFYDEDGVLRVMIGRLR